MQAWQTGEDFRTVLERDAAVTESLSPEALDAAFDFSAFLHYIDIAFQRLGLPAGDEGLAEPS